MIRYYISILILYYYVLCLNCLHTGVSRLTLNEHQVSGSTDAIFIKLKSLTVHDMKVFALKADGEWKFQGSLKAGECTSLGSRIGQQLKYTINDKEYNSFTLTQDKVLYSLEDESTTDEMRKAIDDENFYSLQYNRIWNRPWIGYYGKYGKIVGSAASERSPPKLFMYEALNAGDKYEKVSDAYKWVNGNEIKESSMYTIEVISTAPKVFVIKDFLSDYEVERIIESASSILEQSEVGADSYGGTEYDITQRSSTSCWLPRGTNEITESIYCRAADILGIPRAKMTESSNAEAMQVVHYDTDQRFNCHYDFTIDNEPSCRFLTLLVYLNDQESEDSGGETAFPKTSSESLGLSSDDKTKGFKVHAGKGSAILFYNQLADGNGDYLSLHSGLPVRKGCKWAANIWVSA